MVLGRYKFGLLEVDGFVVVDIDVYPVHFVFEELDDDEPVDYFEHLVFDDDDFVVVENNKPAAAAVDDELTPREREIARLVARGGSNAAIAEQLGLSRRTVEVHLQRIHGKLGIHRRSELTALFDQR